MNKERTQCACALAALALALAAAPAANAHGPDSRRTGYVSNVNALIPNVLGVSVNVVGATNSLRLSNYSGDEIVVRGDHGEPLLRFADESVYENLASSTFYVNASRVVPRFARADARPRWHRVAHAFSYVWRDHRVVWTGIDAPPIVTRKPSEPHLIFNWEIPATAAGKPFKITGLLGWAPPPRPPDDSSRLPILGAALAGCLLAAGAIGMGARRLRRRTPSIPGATETE